MTSRQHWPKPDLLQQRRLELGLPLELQPAPPLLSLVIKGGIGALCSAAWLWALAGRPVAPLQWACSRALSSSCAPLRSASR